LFKNRFFRLTNIQYRYALSSKTVHFRAGEFDSEQLLARVSSEHRGLPATYKLGLSGQQVHRFSGLFTLRDLICAIE